jgi:hypothetical protein
MVGYLIRILESQGDRRSNEPAGLCVSSTWREGRLLQSQGGKERQCNPGVMSKIRYSKIGIPFHGFFEDEDEPEEELPATFKAYVGHIYVELQES